MYCGKKVFTIEMVIELIAVTRIPPGEDTADFAIIRRIEGYLTAGYVPTEDALCVIEKYRRCTEEVRDAAE